MSWKVINIATEPGDYNLRLRTIVSSIELTENLNPRQEQNREYSPEYGVEGEEETRSSSQSAELLLQFWAQWGA